MVDEFAWIVDEEYGQDGRRGSSAELCMPDEHSCLCVSYFYISKQVSWEVTCRIDGYTISKDGREDTTDKAKQKCIEEYHRMKTIKIVHNPNSR